jgi:hypothetical protein
MLSALGPVLNEMLAPTSPSIFEMANLSCVVVPLSSMPPVRSARAGLVSGLSPSPAAMRAADGDDFLHAGFQDDEIDAGDGLADGILCDLGAETLRRQARQTLRRENRKRVSWE